MDVTKTDMGRWLTFIGSPRKMDATPSRMSLDLVEQLMAASRAVHLRSPSASGKMYIDKGNNTKEPILAGIGASPSFGSGTDDGSMEWFWPGGDPPGQTEHGNGPNGGPPFSVFESVETGKLWSD